MHDYYLILVIILGVLAIADLMVGVSNDAVNFLNSAIGSKVVSFKTLMIIASLGVAFGAMSSSGMMEVARKGIFNPEMFIFSRKKKYRIGCFSISEKIFDGQCHRVE